MNELIQRILNGEDSYTQLKKKITNSDKLAQELVAFSNSEGGLLIVGVDDNSNISGLNCEEIRKLNLLIGNVINSHITPPIYPLVKIENIDDKKIVVIKIDEGVNKPYSTNKGIYLTKAGSDKRKISPQELRRLFADSKNIFPDEEIVHNSSIEDLNIDKFKKYLEQDNLEIFLKLKNNELSLEKVAGNLEVFRDKKLTLAGNLIFGENPQRFNPSFYIDCCYFDGNDVSVTKFISKKTIKGTFRELYDDTLRFIVTSLKSYQVERDFNYNGKLEIEEEILSELIVNALVHRDYYIQSSIKIFIFNNRLEIISPGKLTNSLTVEKIISGIAVHRNPVLNSICKSLLPYTGYGSGVKRVLKLNPEIEFINDTEMEQFKCVIYRENSEKLGKYQEVSGKLGNKSSEKLGKSQKKSDKLGEVISWVKNQKVNYQKIEN